MASGGKELIFGNTLVLGNEELFYLWLKGNHLEFLGPVGGRR